MSKQREFKRELYHLLDTRTHGLQHILARNPRGKVPQFNRKRVRQTVSRLQEIVTRALAKKYATKWFGEFAQRKKTWRVTKLKGWGPDEKRKTFQKWYQNRIGTAGCVYAFWKKRKCVYVGRTGKGGSRPSEHFVKFWFSGVTRIDIYEVRAKRQFSALECLAIHRFRPLKNKRETQRNCPLCKVHGLIKTEVAAIFRLKRGRRSVRK
jgi:hypothetical protein